MSKLLMTIILFFTLCFAFSQQAFVSLGQNYTKYNYKNSKGESVEGLRSGYGRFFEAGMAFEITPSKKLLFASSITFNQFNAFAEILNKPYSWTTNYLGLQNVLMYQLFQTPSSLALDLKGGINLSHIISGRQLIDSEIFDISSNDEFAGVFVEPLLGLDFTYLATKNIRLSCGYNFSYGLNTSGSKDQKLGFINHQIELNIYFMPRVIR